MSNTFNKTIVILLSFIAVLLSSQSLYAIEDLRRFEPFIKAEKWDEIFNKELDRVYGSNPVRKKYLRRAEAEGTLRKVKRYLLLSKECAAIEILDLKGLEKAYRCYTEVVYAWENVPKKLGFSKEFITELNNRTYTINDRMKQIKANLKSEYKARDERKLTSRLPSKETEKILVQVRQLLVNKEYARAKNTFSALPTKEKQKKWNLSHLTLEETFEINLNFLLLADKYQEYFNKVRANLEKYEYEARTIKEKNCTECEPYDLSNLFGNSLPLSNHYFGNDFDEEYIRNRIETVEKIAEEAYEALQEKTVEKYDTIAQRKGYKGYSGMPIVSLMHEAQKKGGLENYINSVFGCRGPKENLCKRYNNKIKIIQILKDKLLWSFSMYFGGEALRFTIITNKEPNKMYVENQAIDDGFYVLQGMTTYQTVTGSTATVPAFKKVYLDQ